jgi:hypothetical protein
MEAGKKEICVQEQKTFMDCWFCKSIRDRGCKYGKGFSIHSFIKNIHDRTIE